MLFIYLASLKSSIHRYNQELKAFKIQFVKVKNYTSQFHSQQKLMQPYCIYLTNNSLKSRYTWSQYFISSRISQDLIREFCKMNFTEEDYWSGDIAVTDQGWVFVFVKLSDWYSILKFCLYCLPIKPTFQTQRKHVPNGWRSSADRCPVCLLAWRRASGKLIDDLLIWLSFVC